MRIAVKFTALNFPRMHDTGRPLTGMTPSSTKRPDHQAFREDTLATYLVASSRVVAHSFPRLMILSP